MEVKANQVKSVYVAAARLKMDRVVNFCAQYLVDNLDPATAIEIRSLPGIQRNPELAARVDSFLASQVLFLLIEFRFRIARIYCFCFHADIDRIDNQGSS